MNRQLTEHPVTTWNLPYDNTALRERIGDAEVVARSVVAELHSAARDAVEARPRQGRTWRRGRRS